MRSSVTGMGLFPVVWWLSVSGLVLSLYGNIW